MLAHSKENGFMRTKNHVILPQERRLGDVGLDAADVLGNGGTEDVHEVGELCLEYVADGRLAAHGLSLALVLWLLLCNLSEGLDEGKLQRKGNWRLRWGLKSCVISLPWTCGGLRPTDPRSRPCSCPGNQRCRT